MTTSNVSQAGIFDGVCEILREVLHLTGQAIAPGDKLDLLPNADSVRLMEAVSKMERRFDVEIDDSAIRDAQSVEDVVELIRAELAVAGGAW